MHRDPNHGSDSYRYVCKHRIALTLNSMIAYSNGIIIPRHSRGPLEFTPFGDIGMMVNTHPIVQHSAIHITPLPIIQNTSLMVCFNESILENACGCFLPFIRVGESHHHPCQRTANEGRMAGVMNRINTLLLVFSKIHFNYAALCYQHYIQ